MNRVKLGVVAIAFMSMLQVNAQLPEKSTIAKRGLQGAVLSMVETNYKASMVNGEIQKGEMSGQWIYDYDKNGNLTTCEVIGRTGKMQRKYVYKYDKQGNEVKKIWYSSTGAMYREYVTTYQNEAPVSYVTRDGDGIMIDSSVYTTKNNQIQAETLYSCIGDSISVREYNYTYTNSILTEKYERENTGVRVCDSYKYDGKGRLVQEKRYNDKGELMFHYEYAYNAAGEKVERKSIGENGKVRRIISYEYDKQGNLINETWYDGGKMVLRVQKFTYTYDKNDNWITKVSYEGMDERVIAITVRSIDY